jgi:hypothetical protein
MTAYYRIDAALGLVFSVGEGVLTSEEVLSHNLRLSEDPSFDPDYSQLIEVRATRFDIPADQVAQIAASENIFNEHSKRAYVAENDLNFGMTRALAARGDSLATHTKLFRHLDEARRWLELD